MGRGSHSLHLAWQGVASHTSPSMIHPKFNFMPQSLARAIPFDCNTLPYLIHVLNTSMGLGPLSALPSRMTSILRSQAERALPFVSRLRSHLTMCCMELCLSMCPIVLGAPGVGTKAGSPPSPSHYISWHLLDVNTCPLNDWAY